MRHTDFNQTSFNHGAEIEQEMSAIPNKNNENEDILKLIMGLKKEIENLKEENRDLKAQNLEILEIVRKLQKCF